MPIKAVVFDLDNTLYDYDTCNELAEKKLFDTISIAFDVTEDYAEELLKQAKRNIKKQLGDKVAASHNRLLYMQNICEQMRKNPMIYAIDFYNAYWDTMLENMQLFDYVEPLMNELKTYGIKIGILTDLTAHIQYRKLSKLGLTEIIDYLVTSEEAGAEKPSDKMFNLMLNKLGLLPEEVLMVGDSPKKDIEGARKAGIEGILVGNNIGVLVEKIENLIYLDRKRLNETFSCSALL